MARSAGWVVACETARENSQLKARCRFMTTDQRPTTQPSCIVNCSSWTRLFQGLSIEELTLNSKFKVVNTLIIDYRWLWGLEISLRFPLRVTGRFGCWSGEKQWKGGRGRHVQCRRVPVTNEGFTQVTANQALQISTLLYDVRVKVKCQARFTFRTLTLQYRNRTSWHNTEDRVLSNDWHPRNY